jgi:hypothetical protein
MGFLRNLFDKRLEQQQMQLKLNAFNLSQLSGKEIKKLNHKYNNNQILIEHKRKVIKQ